MKKINLGIIGLISQIFILLILSTNLFAGPAGTKTNVQMGTTSGGHYYFLDKDTGKIYIYNSDFSQCLYQFQITRLGQPAVLLNSSY